MKKAARKILLAIWALMFALAIIIGYTIYTTPQYFDLVIGPREWNRPMSEEISRTDALHDWAVLERIIQTGYGRYESLRMQGTDWDALFAEGHEAIAAEEEMLRTCRLRDIIQHLLDRIPDRHSGTHPLQICKQYEPEILPKAFAASLWLLPDHDRLVNDNLLPPGVSPGAQLLDCSGFDLDKDLHFAATKKGDRWQFGYRVVFMAKTSPETIDCRFRRTDGKEEWVTIGDNHLTVEKEPLQTPEIRVVPGDTTHVRIGTFKGSSVYNRLLNPPSDSATITTSRTIIVDLKQNAGGNSGHFNRWAETLVARRLEWRSELELVSDTTCQGGINDVTLGISGSSAALYYPSFGLAIGRFLVLIRNSVVMHRQPFSNLIPAQTVLTGRAQAPFAGDMVLVVDNGCASACESAVLTARRAFDAVVVGTNTKGYFASGSGLPYRLPQSGIGLQVASVRHVLDGENFRENRGFMPDVWVDLRDGGAMARELGECFADPVCRSETMPLIREAGERHRELSVY